MKNNIKKIVKIILLLAFACVACIVIYMLSSNKNINLPKISDIEEILIKDDDRVVNIEDKKEIEKIYNILENKKSVTKTKTNTSAKAKKITKLSFIVGDKEKSKLSIYINNNMYFVENSNNKVFELSEKEYDDIMTYLQKGYTIGEMSNLNVTDNKIMMKLEKESSGNDKIIIKNMTDNTYEYGEDFDIEILKDNVWYKIKWDKEPTFNLILNTIKGKTENTIEIDEKFKKTLEQGKYRFVKSFTLENAKEEIETVYSAAEFEI